MTRPTGRTPIYYELLAACREDGCPICRLGQRAAEQFVDHLLYEYVNDPGAQSQIVAARGYCNRHAWLLPEGHIRKHDYRFRDEGYGAEADSWRSAIEIVSGRKGAR